MTSDQMVSVSLISYWGMSVKERTYLLNFRIALFLWPCRQTTKSTTFHVQCAKIERILFALLDHMSCVLAQWFLQLRLTFNPGNPGPPGRPCFPLGPAIPGTPFSPFMPTAPGVPWENNTTIAFQANRSRLRWQGNLVQVTKKTNTYRSAVLSLKTSRSIQSRLTLNKSDTQNLQYSLHFHEAAQE